MRIIIFIIRFYQSLSPIIMGVSRVYCSCPFYPSCSEYGVAALKKHGVLKGALFAFYRVVRCHPFRKPTYDPF